MVKRYISRPTAVEAVELNHENLQKMWDWMGGHYVSHGFSGENQHLSMVVNTPHGKARAMQGDFIVKAGPSDFYPVKKDVFIRKYSEAGKGL